MWSPVDNTVLAFVHAPLTIPRVGTVKVEDMHIVKLKKAEKLTSFDYEITR